MPPPTKAVLDRLSNADAGYPKDLVLSALLTAKGDEQKALEVLRGKDPEATERLVIATAVVEAPTTVVAVQPVLAAQPAVAVQPGGGGGASSLVEKLRELQEAKDAGESGGEGLAVRNVPFLTRLPTLLSPPLASRLSPPDSPLTRPHLGERVPDGAPGAHPQARPVRPPPCSPWGPCCAACTATAACGVRRQDHCPAACGMLGLRLYTRRVRDRGETGRGGGHARGG